ncbi:MAG: hypothetical protein AB1894_07540 [Chloroflexota bacterium]
MNASVLSVAERSFRDIAIAERQMRQQAEQAMHAYVRLLTAMANQYAGQALEKERRASPFGTETWQPERWEAFLTQYVFMKPGAGWGGGPANLSSDDPCAATTGDLAGQFRLREETLHNSVAHLRDVLAKTLSELDALQQEVKPSLPGPVQVSVVSPALPLVPGEPLLDDLARFQAKSRPPAVLIVNPSQALPAGLPEPLPTQAEVTPLPEAAPEQASPSSVTDPIPSEARPRSHAGIVEELRRWQSPTIPMRFRQLAGVSPDRWHKQSMALYLVARYGITSRLEIDALLSQATDADRRTSALRKAVDLLPELGFLTRENLEVAVQDGVNSRFVVMDLTRQGRELCEIFGWQIAESDRARALRLFRGSGEQLLGVFFLAAQARLRGYSALVFPTPDLASAPDLLLERGTENRSAFVEFTPQLSERWRNAGDLPGPLAFFTLTRQARTQLLALLKNEPQPHLAHAALTDFETLISVRKITPDAPLWPDIW